MKNVALRMLVVALIVLSLPISGCFTTRYYFGTNNAPEGEVHRATQHTFIYGLVSPGKTNLDGMCGAGGIKEIKSQVGGVGLIINWITLGLWTPVTVKVTCGRAS